MPSESAREDLCRPWVLEVDATTTPLPGTWSGLEFELHTLPGVDNSLPRSIYILPLDIGNGCEVGENEDVTITVPRVAGFTITVPAGSATFPDGSKSGLVSLGKVTGAGGSKWVPDGHRRARRHDHRQGADHLYDHR